MVLVFKRLSPFHQDWIWYSSKSCCFAEEAAASSEVMKRTIYISNNQLAYRIPMVIILEHSLQQFTFIYFTLRRMYIYIYIILLYNLSTIVSVMMKLVHNYCTMIQPQYPLLRNKLNIKQEFHY